MAVNRAQVRRAVARARRGQALNVEEVAALLESRDDDLADIQELARDLRERGAEAAGRVGLVTYSPKVFIPLTRLCRDRCGYCTFATDPAELRRRGEGYFLTLDEVEELARAGADAGCAEALFTLGDRPEGRWPAAAQWLAEAGYDSTLDYLRAAAVRVLETSGLLPHLNPGVMTWQELLRLRPVAPSMGMMLETTSRRLFDTPGAPHYGSPDKDPAVRLRVLTDAGRANVPFTSGVLVGIGETSTELADSLLTLRAQAREYRAIAEVIVQNFRAKPDTALRHADDLGPEAYAAALATARIVLGPGMRVQAPPNLTDAADLALLLDSGVDDFGGISPLTPDHVNPERPWPQLDVLREVCQRAGLTLRPRLAVHPEYVRDAERWIDPRLHPHVAALADADGLLDTEAVPQGRPWQESDSYADLLAPTAAGSRAVPAGSAGVRAEESDDGGTGDRHGDWDAVAARTEHIGGAPPGRRSALPAMLSAALRRAESDPASLADERHRDEAVALAAADGAGLAAMAEIADAWRREAVGDDVTYVVNRNINFTNVCYTGCRFCAFARRESDPGAVTLSLDEVGRRVDEAVAVGATEICMQGGIHPRLGGAAYFELIDEVTRRPVHLHAFSPMEVVNAASRADLSIRDWLRAAREAGLGSIPGTAAEILDDEVRWILTKGKLPTEAWVDVVGTAHEVGLPSTATMMYGHVDSPHHWVTHLRVLRDLGRRTGGFTEFVGLPFVHQHAPIYLSGIARAGSTPRDDLAVTALARLLLHGVIDNIQVSWVKLGPQVCAQLLSAGANDLGGTLMEETISNSAGSSFGSALTVEQLREIAESANRPARERTTLYGRVVARPAARERQPVPAAPAIS